MNSDNLLLLIVCIFGALYSIYVIIYEQRSVRSKLVEDAIRISGYKNHNSKEENVLKEIEKRKSEGDKKYKLPKMLLKSKIKKYKHENMDYYVLNENNSAKKIFYLHGGDYFDQPLFLHFSFCDSLAQKLNCEVIMPIYPKTPFHDHKYSQEKVLSLYKKLCNTEDIILMGDSSGGGFCLSLYYLLVKEKFQLPSQTILLSPWLDVSMSNSDINYIEDLDPQLSVVALKEMGNLWAGKSSLKNPLVSPLYGDVSVLKNVVLFVGTHELLLPDCHVFRDKCKKNHVKLEYHEYKKMTHVFIIQPIPEAKKAFNELIKIINKK